MTDYGQARSPERVWKYEWAIIQAAGVSDELADFSSEAEAAMILADAEIEKGIALMREKVARARAERDALASARDLWRGRAMDKSAENARLRAELDRANQRLAIADEMQRERACLTPDYTDGPCHCAHCDPAALERDNARLRDELVEAEKSRDIQVIRLRAAQTTIERVRNALDDTTGTHADAVERAYKALNGEKA